MSLIPEDSRMKPVIVLPPDTMSDDDVKSLRDNRLCVVVSKDPSSLKFLDPIPEIAQRTKIEDAAIKLSRKILDRRTWTSPTHAGYRSLERSDIVALFLDILTVGSPLDANPSQAELEKREYDRAKIEEAGKIAREDARAEAAARKAAKVAKK